MLIVTFYPNNYIFTERSPGVYTTTLCTEPPACMEKSCLDGNIY